MIVGCSVHLQSGLLAQATDRRVTHVIRSCNVREHFACLSASNGFPTLLAGQLWLPATDNSPRLCTLAPLAGTSPDQLALELGETAQNSQHQATMRRRGVSPSISQRLKPRPFFRDRSQEIEEIAGRLANRSSRVTTSTSPFVRTPIRRVSCFRSERAPLIFS